MAEDTYVVEALLSNFPFLMEIREYISSLKLRLEDFENADNLVEAAVKKVEASIQPRSSRQVNGASTTDVEIVSHPLAMAIVAMLDSPYAKRRFATYEAERYTSMLKNIKEGQKQVLSHVISKVLGMRVNVENPPYEFWIHFKDYLKVAVNLNEPRFKLVNRTLNNGYVGLTRAEAFTIVKNGLEKLIHERLENIGRVEPPPFLVEHVDRLRKKLEMYRQKETYTFARLDPAMWPPCMQTLRRRLIEGEPVSHFGNFAIASFMLRIGMTVDEVIEAYSQRGDFDQRIARYQVEHIAGLKGSRTKYSAPSCATMQAHGLCIEEGRLCGGVRSPMQFYRRRAMVVKGPSSGEEGQPMQNNR